MAWVALAALAAAGVVVRLTAHRRSDRELRWCAAALEALLTSELGKLALSALVLGPARAGGRVPFAGWERGAFSAHTALTLAAYALPAALCWQTFTRLRPALWVAVPWVGCSALLANAYPGLRGGALLDALRWHLVGSVTFALIGVFLGERPDRFHLGRAQLVSLVLLAGPAAELAGPLLHRDPVARWALAQATWTVVLAAAALAAAWRRPWISRRS